VFRANSDSTPRRHESVNMRIANHLSNIIGPRVSGTPKEKEAVEFLAGEFRKLQLDIRIQKFSYLGWIQKTPPSLDIHPPFRKTLKVSPMAYTGSTPKAGVEGLIRAYGTFYLFPGLLDVPKYVLTDKQGETLASVLVLPGHEPRPIPNPWHQIFQEPMILICEEDFRPVREAVDAGKDVMARLVSTAEYVQSFTSYNVVATIPGESPETIVVGGHHDSIEGSPGAVDNAAGVEAIFRLADRLVSGKRRYTIRLITWGGHEWGLFGSQYFVKDAKERGVLDRIRACLTLDVLGCGDYLWIWAGPESFRKRLELIVQQGRFSQKREVRFEDTLVGSDDWSFALENIPNAMLMDWPMETLHLPADKYETIDERKVDFGAETALAFLNHFEREGF
jgi:hypothetical protein